MFGFDTAVINGAIPFFSEYFQLSDAMKGWAVSSALVGCIAGALVIGWPGDKFGRKATLQFLAILFLISAIGSGMADSVASFVIYRFVGGIAVGGASVIAPMYISEIAPPAYRGRLAVTFQLAIVVGVLIAFFSDYLLIDTGENNWRWMFITEAIPALIFFVLLFSVSKSPRWLVQKGKIEEAKSIIKYVNGDVVNVEQTITDIIKSLSGEAQSKTRNIFNKPYRRLVVIGILAGMFNQLTGINVIMYYATDIFRMAGFSTDSSIGQTVIIGFANLIFTLIAMRVIDHFGRKKMLLVGSLGMPVFLLLFAWAFFNGSFEGYFLVMLLIGFTAFFAFSQGAVIWVILSEMFPNSIRARATSISSFSIWFFNGLSTFLFPVVVGALGGKAGIGYAFLFYSVITLMSFFFFRKYLIETKGKSLEQIEKEILK